MKISDIPQSGKRGKTVSMQGRYGQVSRILAVPANPETPYQLTIRRNLRKVSAAWRALTEAQRAAWITAAQNARSHSRLGAGRATCNSYRILGACPAPIAGAADITGLYTARYGVPPAGMKVFILVNQFVDGWEDIAAKFSAIVPTGA
jgi:hypothetical protein